MKYGAVFPQTEIGENPDDVRTFITEVERMGYDYLLAYDHVTGANPDRDGGWNGPYTYQTQFHEIFTLFAYGAALTTTLEFVSGILILPQRETALVAKQTAQIDILTQGRFRLGVAVGWNKVEMQSLGKDFHTRGKRIEEQVHVLNLLWQNELVTYQGDYHTLDDVGINPLPIQRPIPVWFGGGADVVLRRMAKMGAGWMPSFMPPERGQDYVDKLRGYLNAEGRSIGDFGIDIRLSTARQPQSEWQSYLDGWDKLGATHAAMITMGAGYQSVDEHLEALREFKDFVG